ncbi:MAG: PEP-CTERM sorting domain-containing protein [Sedimentisphaerales bacterium]|jgi:hypothetical protein
MSRYISAILFSTILLFATPIVNATITDWRCAPDGAITMSYTNLTFDSGEWFLDMDGVQSDYPAHLGGYFTTSGPLDPTVRIQEGIDNDTAFAWTDYHITIGMDNSTFSIFDPAGLVMPAGWTAVVTAPVPGNMPNGGGPGYVGIIDYYMGTGGSPVAINGSADFGFKISFTGTGTTSFSTEQIPTPEPATIGLLGLGAMALLRRRKA